MADNTTTTEQVNFENKRADKDGNEIGRYEKRIAGLILIFFTIMSTMGIIAYWPDRLPDPTKRISLLYQHKLFRICLVGIPDTLCCPDSNYKFTTTQMPVKQAGSKQPRDSADTLAANLPADTTLKKSTPTGIPVWVEKAQGKLIHLNTILLLLVCLGGFLGNMIHITTSFTTYIGAGKFKRSWLLWYCLRPFTASALAIGIYFIFRAGFLNMSDGGQSINLYGLMSISILAGLFTDKATEKLREIFEVIFKSKDVRPNPLVDKFKIIGVTPLLIEKSKENVLTLTGENLDKQKLVVSINNEIINNPVFTNTTIKVAYTIPDSQKDEAKFKISVKDENGKEHFTSELELKK